MRVERRTVYLLGALIIIVAVAIWSYGGGSTPAAVTAVPRATAADPRQASAAAQAPIDVRIEALSAERPEPASTGRNPFEFRARQALPPPSMPTGELAGMSVPNAPVGPPPPVPIGLKYIGLVEGQAGLRVAVLSDGKSSPVYGVQGETILGRYRIVTIGVESIELEQVDGRGRQTIRLTGQ